MSNEFQFLIYQSAEEDVSVDAFVQNETIWITANQTAVLLDKSESTIRKHINNVFDEGELDRENNTQKVRVDGVKQPVAMGLTTWKISGRMAKEKASAEYEEFNKTQKSPLILTRRSIRY